MSNQSCYINCRTPCKFNFITNETKLNINIMVKHSLCTGIPISMVPSVEIGFVCNISPTKLTELQIMFIL